MNARPGHSLAELVAALPLASLLLAVLLASFLAQARLGRTIAARLGRAETERIAVGVLRQELRWAAEPDLASVAADSMTLRLLRGIAVTCGGGGGEHVVAEWWGLREPNPDKDSVLAVGPAGEVRARVLGSEAVTAGCGVAPARRLRLDTPVSPGVLLVYEHASYHLGARALRVRAGAEGRQPLTEEWLDDAGTGLMVTSPGTLPRGIHLRTRGVPPQTWSWALPNAASP